MRLALSAARDATSLADSETFAAAPLTAPLIDSAVEEEVGVVSGEAMAGIGLEKGAFPFRMAHSRAELIRATRAKTLPLSEQNFSHRSA
ncbi:MAG: hypothetical protein NVV63_05910 [Opitutus sp.]|nr:hypothetical protein [Opitutus sp.]